MLKSLAEFEPLAVMSQWFEVDDFNHLDTYTPPNQYMPCKNDVNS
jgi:hypothetical protein